GLGLPLLSWSRGIRRAPQSRVVHRLHPRLVRSGLPGPRPRPGGVQPLGPQRRHSTPDPKPARLPFHPQPEKQDACLPEPDALPARRSLGLRGLAGTHRRKRRNRVEGRHMILPAVVSFLYGGVVLIGGFIGYRKAGSRPSLIAGAVSD